MRAPVRLATLAVALISLLGCSSSDKNGAAPCPRVSVLADAAKMTRFKAGQGRDVTDIELQAEVGSYKGYCSYDMDSRTMTLVLQIGIDAERGPAAVGRTAGLSYFVAVPRFYPRPEAKQVLPVQVSFPENVSRVRFVDDEVTISFPLQDFKELPGYEVFVGLQLDKDQLDYNRQNKPRI